MGQAVTTSFFGLLEALLFQRELCFFFVVRAVLLFFVSHVILFSLDDASTLVVLVPMSESQ